VDERTREAWSSHPKHRVVDNSTGFDEKVWRVTQEVVEVGPASGVLNPRAAWFLESITRRDMWSRNIIVTQFPSPVLGFSTRCQAA
jgi:hypothetical protein